MRRWFSAAFPAVFAALVASAIAAGCGGSHHAARKDDTVAPLLRNDPPAPVDPQIAGLPGARGFWMPDDEYGQVYVVTVGPAHAPAGPTLVLVHGLGTNGMRDWYPVLAPLAEHRRVVM